MRRIMHIAFNGYFWNQPHTGSGQYTRQLIYQLNRLVADLEITLVYPLLPGAAEPADVPPSVRVDSVPIRSGHVGKVQFEQQLFPQAVRRSGAELAHVPYWGGPLQSPVPLVVTIHDVTTLQVPEYHRGVGSRLYYALVSAAARGASHIITDSFSAKLDIMDTLGIQEERITAIYLGVGPQFSDKDGGLVDMAVRRKYDLPDLYILYLGGYERHKNIINLLHAHTYVSQALGEDYPLVLAGRKPTEVSPVYPDYDDYISRSHLDKYVRWIGFVDEADKPALYRQAEAFVFPSRYEGFGLPPLEAMASGTPVVTSDSGPLPEVIGAAGFAIDPDDVRAMAGSIIALVIQEETSAEMRRLGREQAARFTWETTATDTLLVYDQVLRQANPSRGQTNTLHEQGQTP
jgi:glycosyltransferase involved in cell wall biosynthesis